MHNIFNKFISWIRRVFHLEQSPIDNNQNRVQIAVENPHFTPPDGTISQTQSDEESCNASKEKKIINESQKGISVVHEENTNEIKNPITPLDAASTKQPVDDNHCAGKTSENPQQLENIDIHIEEPSNVIPHRENPMKTTQGEEKNGPISIVNLPI